jgi:hypothetical protein
MIFGGSNIPAVSNTHDGLAKFAVDEIFKPATQELALMALAEKKVMKGESFVIPNHSNLAQEEDEAGEFDAYPEARVDFGDNEVSAVDCGLTLVVTRQAMESAHPAMELLQSNKDVLKEHLARSLDKRIATALRTALVKCRASSSTALDITVNGTPGGAAQNELNVYLVQLLATKAKSRFNMKPRGGNEYALVSSYENLLAIENDASLRNVIQGKGQDALRSYYMGKLGMVGLYGTNHEDAIDTSVGSSSVSEYYLLGAQSHFVAFRRAPEVVLFDDRQSKVTEFGKFKYLHYDFAAAFGLFTASVNKDEVRVIHGSST